MLSNRAPPSPLPTPQLLLKLAKAAKLREKIDNMFAGEHINSTEDRAVLHVATRARRDQASRHTAVRWWSSRRRRGPCSLDLARVRVRGVQKIFVDGKNVVPDVWDVLDKIKNFTDKVRNGEWKGVTGKSLKNVVAIGIGGSFLGPLFVHTALRCVFLVLRLVEGGPRGRWRPRPRPAHSVRPRPWRLSW